MLSIDTDCYQVLVDDAELLESVREFRVLDRPDDIVSFFLEVLSVALLRVRERTTGMGSFCGH